MFCRYCGTSNPTDSRFCRICGKQLDGTTDTLTPDAIAPVLPLIKLTVSDIQPAAGNAPMVQGTPQISGVPSVQGTPSSPGGPTNATPPTHLSSSASQEALRAPNASEQSSPSHNSLASQAGSSHVTHTHSESHPPEHHPHMPPHHEPPLHHWHTQSSLELQSHSTSLPSTASQQTLSTGVRVAGHISRRALLIALASGAAVATVGAGVVIYNNAVSTPEKTISNYLDAIKRRDGQTAYEQLSSRFQSQTNEQQFISNVNLAGGFIGSYTISAVQVNGSSAIASVSVTALIVTVNYSVHLVQENGVWKLDGGTLISIH